jgi:hypothetical protein
MNKKTGINYNFLLFLTHFFMWMGISMYLLTKFGNLTSTRFIIIMILELTFTVWISHNYL